MAPRFFAMVTVVYLRRRSLRRSLTVIAMEAPIGRERIMEMSHREMRKPK